MAMASRVFPRFTSRAIDRLSRASSCKVKTSTRSTSSNASFAAPLSSKLSQGFVPPTQEDLLELRERVQEFTRREITAEKAAQVDRTNTFPPEMWSKLGEAGFLGITVEEDLGGLAMGYQAHCIVMEELSRASASIALSYAAHSQLCINQIRLHGTSAQCQKYLPNLVRGSAVGALAMSEHGAGSDVVSMRTTATPTDGGWLLNGSKMWITNGPEADYIVVYAKTDVQAGSKGISAFILETKSAPDVYVAGFSVAQKLDKLGMRGSNTGELAFNNIFIPSANLLGPLNQGVGVLMSGLDLERLVLSAGPLGILRAALDIALPYTHQRVQFNMPIASTQLMQAKLADMYTSYLTAASLTYTVAAAVDKAEQPHFLAAHSLFPQATRLHDDARDQVVKSQDCAAAILYAAEQATKVALQAIQCLGGTGYINDVAAGRLLRDAKLYEIGAGTSEVRRLVIGRSFNRMYAG